MIVYCLLPDERRVVEALIERAREPFSCPGEYRVSSISLLEALRGNSAPDLESDRLDEILDRLEQAGMIKPCHVKGGNRVFRLVCETRRRGYYYKDWQFYREFCLADMLENGRDIERRPTCAVHPLELRLWHALKGWEYFFASAYRKVIGKTPPRGARSPDALRSWMQRHGFYRLMKTESASWCIGIPATWKEYYASPQFPPMWLVPMDEERRPNLKLVWDADTAAA